MECRTYHIAELMPQALRAYGDHPAAAAEEDMQPRPEAHAKQTAAAPARAPHRPVPLPARVLQP